MIQQLALTIVRIIKKGYHVLFLNRRGEKKRHEQLKIQRDKSRRLMEIMRDI